MHCPVWVSGILDAGYLGQKGKTIVLANGLNQNGGLAGKASVNCPNASHENERMLESVECSDGNSDGSGYPACVEGDDLLQGRRIRA